MMKVKVERRNLKNIINGLKRDSIWKSLSRESNEFGSIYVPKRQIH